MGERVVELIGWLVGRSVGCLLAWSVVLLGGLVVGWFVSWFDGWEGS